MTEIVYGKKYERGLDVAEIAKRVRTEIKAAVTAGELPKALKARVRISRYSGGQSLNVKLTVPGMRVYRISRLLAERDEPHGCHPSVPWRSDAAAAIVAKVEAIVAAYNFDGSDTMTDYFHVNFYGNVDLDGDRDAELALLPPPGTPEAAALRYADAVLACTPAKDADDEAVLRARAELALKYGKTDRARSFLAACPGSGKAA